jgi:hypothetical protein
MMRLSFEVVMVRSLALLVLPLLLAGCGSSGTSSQPDTTIDSFRSSFFSGQQSPPSSQVAAMPQPAAGEAKSAPKSLSPDRSAKAPQDFQPDSAQPKDNGNAPYKAAVAAYIKRYAVDSNLLKQAKIGTPFQGSVNGQKGSVVCVQLGAINENRTAYLLKDDAVSDSEIGAPACRDKRLEPWGNVGS